MPSAPSSRVDWAGVLRLRNFRLLWTAGLISQTGDWALFVGLPFFVYRLTGSALATGTLFAAALLPQVLLGSVAGVFVDRWDRRRTMIAADLLLAAGLLPLWFVHSGGQIGIVYGVAVFESSVEQFFVPAEGSLLPRLVGESRLMEANAFYGTSRQVARLLGAACGAVLIGTAGLIGIVAADAVSFLASAALLARIKSDGGSESAPPTHEPATVARAWHRFWVEWVAGLRISWNASVGRAVLIFAMTVGIGEGVFATLAAPFIVSVLHGTGADYGWFFSVQAVGGLAGAAVIALVGRQWDPTRTLPAAAVTFGLVDLAIFTYPLAWATLEPAFVLVAAVGVPAAAFFAAYSALSQRAVPDRERGRFLGSVGTSFSFAMVAGILLSGILAPQFGVIPMLEIQGIAPIVGGVFVWRSVRGAPSLQRLPGGRTEASSP